ncbi:transcriptional repressor [Mycobacterium phage DyoEdafos]|uniref:Immunity repressor n=1 Tax=Mycobacterium phage DyoEdafos TaxID=2599860 RepID=A0A5J6THM1_9CAUD|nr:transcriptional repressor [Mycobacterium phage DyoEdafos]QFG10270.1 immunity repressor [Mycobacterium phage DyoEdafos]
MSAKDEDNDLIVVISYLLKRQVRMQEALGALGMSRSTYYEQRDKGVLNSIPNLMALADHFGLDKVDLLVRFGHLDKTDLLTYLEREGEVIADEELANPPQATILRVVRRPKPRMSKPKARTDIPPL